jgi:asparagine synthase (glutamine-hydrolysing)
VEFAMRCPVSLKLNNLSEVVRMNENEPGAKSSKYFERTRDGKQILRDVMARHIPDSITGGLKQGFSGPDASWFKGESIDFVKRSLLDRSARIYDVLDRKALVPMIEQHMRGEENQRLLIWSLLNVEAWMKAYL